MIGPEFPAVRGSPARSRRADPCPCRLWLGSLGLCSFPIAGSRVSSLNPANLTRTRLVAGKNEDGRTPRLREPGSRAAAELAYLLGKPGKGGSDGGQTRGLRRDRSDHEGPLYPRIPSIQAKFGLLWRGRPSAQTAPICGDSQPVWAQISACAQSVEVGRHLRLWAIVGDFGRFLTSRL
jgi:hypothetical protein